MSDASVSQEQVNQDINLLVEEFSAENARVSTQLAVARANNRKLQAQVEQLQQMVRDYQAQLVDAKVEADKEDADLPAPSVPSE